MEHILVPIDFTKASIVGVEKAITIARKENAEIHLVNIIPPAKGKKSDPKEVQLDHTLNLLKENESKLSSLLQEIAADGLKIHSEIKVDKLESGLKKYMSNHKIDLMVVGINGAHTVGDLFCLGRDKKLIKVNCPIEVVKQAS